MSKTGFNFSLVIIQLFFYLAKVKLCCVQEFLAECCDWHRWKVVNRQILCFGARHALTHLLNNKDTWKRGLKGGRCYKARYSKQVLIRPYVLCMNLCLCDRIDARPCWNWSCMPHEKNFLSHVSYLTVNVEDDNFFCFDDISIICTRKIFWIIIILFFMFSYVRSHLQSISALNFRW